MIYVMYLICEYYINSYPPLPDLEESHIVVPSPQYVAYQTFDSEFLL